MDDALASFYPSGEMTRWTLPGSEGGVAPTGYGSVEPATTG
jgi:hypothetical protein